MAKMLTLEPEDKKKLDPEALKWFNDQRATIQREVPLEELSDDDLNTFLSDNEKREFQSCMNEIAKGLATCINKDGASPDPLTSAKVDLTVLQSELNLWIPMHNIGLLLKKVYERKVAKVKKEKKEREEAAEVERREQEEQERWQAARKAVNPPIDDAKRYLIKKNTTSSYKPPVKL